MEMKDVKAVFIDTNVLIRANVTEAPNHAEYIRAIKSLRKAKKKLWLSRQVLREYVAVLTRPQTFLSPQPISTITQRIRYLQKSFRIAEDNAEVTEQLLKLAETIPMGGKQVHDANIVATTLVYNVDHLLTLNTIDFQRFSPHITLLTPEDIK